MSDPGDFAGRLLAESHDAALRQAKAATEAAVASARLLAHIGERLDEMLAEQRITNQLLAALRDRLPPGSTPQNPA